MHGDDEARILRIGLQLAPEAADEHVDGIVDIICNAARTGAVGDGKIWVEPVEEVIRIRTGEHGPAAV